MVISPRKADGVVPPSLYLLRAATVGVYIGIVLLCFTSSSGPRVLWTLVVPLLPLFVIVAGFHTWRLVCPLAWLASLGLRLQALGDRARRALRLRPRQAGRPVRRVPAWMEEWYFAVSLGFLMLMLVCRLVLINGDGRWLGLVLIGLAALAAATNFVFSGKTWCNFLCPVGVVERIFTDPQLRATPSSQCAACSACKKNCPDIDQANAYWKDVTRPGRRLAFYAYPGVVLAFYAYFWLRDGRWDRYLDGSALRMAAGRSLVLGPGFFFLPRVPAVAAAALTLGVLAIASYSLFDLIESLLARWLPDTERRRHHMLMLVGFISLNLYYVLAVPPILRGLPLAAHVVAFIVPVVATWALVRRWRQSSEGFAQARSARRLVPLWPLESPPPRDPAALLAFFKGQEVARAAQLDAYREAVQLVVAEGSVRSRDLRLLDRLRSDLSIGDRDHVKLVAALPDEERLLLEAKQAARLEKQRQHDAERIEGADVQPPPPAERSTRVAKRSPRLPRALLRLRLAFGSASARLFATLPPRFLYGLRVLRTFLRTWARGLRRALG